MMLRCKILISSLFLLAFWLGTHVCGAQFTENFSDGDFSSNPVWSGDITEFAISNGMLQSNGSNIANQKLHLQTSNTKIDDTEWSFLVD